MKWGITGGEKCGKKCGPCGGKGTFIGEYPINPCGGKGGKG